MTSAKVMTSIAILLDLIDKQDWQTFQSAALSSSAFFRALTAAIANCPEFNGMTLLHAVVRCNPPLDIVTKMIEICPDLPAAKDCLGRTPLHVAAGSAAKPRLIKLIAHAHPASCDAQDEDGKTPLHFACDSSCVLFEDDDNTNQSMPREVCHDSVRALLSESLLAATIEDMDEMNPLEYAIMSDAELNTVKLLQKASCKTLQSISRSSSPSTVPETRPRRVVSDPDMAMVLSH
jgi:ankyrin repeat protein